MGNPVSFIYTQTSIITFKSIEDMFRCKDELMALSVRDQNGNPSKLNFDLIDNLHAFVYGNFERYANSMAGLSSNTILHIGQIIQKYAAKEFQVTYRSIRTNCIHEITSFIRPNGYQWQNKVNSFEIDTQLPDLTNYQYTDICSNTQSFYKFISFLTK